MNRRLFLHRTAATAAGVLTRTALAASDDSYPIGCCTQPWDQFEYRVALDGIAEAGFTHAGLMTAGSSFTSIPPPMKSLP
jgi:hypothetical protein